MMSKAEAQAGKLLWSLPKKLKMKGFDLYYDEKKFSIRHRV